MIKIKHLEEAGMTWYEHFCFAWIILLKMQGACWALMIHMICPWWFETTASDTIKKLAKDLEY